MLCLLIIQYNQYYDLKSYADRIFIKPKIRHVKEMSTKQHDLITADYDRKYEPGYGHNYPDTSLT